MPSRTYWKRVEARVGHRGSLCIPFLSAGAALAICTLIGQPSNTCICRRSSRTMSRVAGIFYLEQGAGMGHIWLRHGVPLPERPERS